MSIGTLPDIATLMSSPNLPRNALSCHKGPDNINYTLEKNVETFHGKTK